MRAVVVDPANREVREIETEGRLRELQGVVCGNIEAVYLDDWVPQLTGHHFYVNADGRMMPELAMQRWSLRGWPEAWLCGPAILLTDDGRGGESAVTVSVETVRELVAFV